MTEILKFFDMKTKTSFETSDYREEKRIVRGVEKRYLVALCPSGCEHWKVQKKKD